MRVYNFSAGPSMLPDQILEQAQREMLNYNGLGFSALEMRHRSKDFEEIIEEVKSDLRALADIPDDYEILLLQGGASTQFAMVPLNLMVNKKADYIDTGIWASKAYKEAGLFGDVKIAASSKDRNYSYIPDLSKIKFRDDIDYIHITENNTIYGTEYKSISHVKGHVLVNDASSTILSKPMDVNKFGLIYAGAQKNLGTAGVTLVIIKKDLINEDLKFACPTMMKYYTHYKNDSRYNTPPVYAIYIMGKVLKWLRDLGGLEEIQKINEEKAKIIYDYLDDSKLFKGYADKDFRSSMNITFTTGLEQLDKVFADKAKEKALVNLKGHRDLGGLRASVYNAMPLEGVKRLRDFMWEFEKSNK